MVLFISFFKKFPALFYSAFFIVSIEIILHFIPRLEYLEHGGSFYTFYKRKIAEDPAQNFDILLFGDSRSLSLNGFTKKEQDHSLYNFSLPAAGPRYVQYYLKKYLELHSEKPRSVVWALDVEQYPMAKSKTFDGDKKLWETYKHRLLNLFSFQDSLEQYSGTELLFIMKEYLPTIFYTYKYREGLKDLLNSLKADTFIKGETYHTIQNKLIETLTAKQNGQLNLGDYFLANEEQGTLGYESSYNQLNKEEVDFSFQPLEDFINYAHKNKIKVTILILPKAGSLYDTTALKPILKKLRSDFINRKNVQLLEFPELNYPRNLFSEGIHYNTNGANILNKEYMNTIVPKIINFSKDSYNEN